jgi:hypothetical protein
MKGDRKIYYAVENDMYINERGHIQLIIITK